MTYTVHESFLTIQGEGFHAGRVAVFCRFAGCNLWTGREQDRASAICRFCDTEFRGGEKYKTAGELVRRLVDLWPTEDRPRFVVLTGGEPLLQVDAKLLDGLHWAGFYVAVESNGTVQRPPGIDWLCVSPKAGTKLAIKKADEVKIVYPQEGIDLDDFDKLSWPRRSLQPMDGPHLEANTKATVDYCLANPAWRMSVQTHKLIGVR